MLTTEFIKIITTDISTPPKKYMKQNKEKDFIIGLFEVSLKTHIFAKTYEAKIPVKYPLTEENKIFLKTKYDEV